MEHVEEDRYRTQILDPSNLLVNCREQATKDGFQGLQPEAFLSVAETDPSVVDRTIVVDALDKQSVAIAEQIFSEKVEKKMVELCFDSTAKFVKHIRNWYEAIDQPGPRCIGHVRKLLDFKEWLLKIDMFFYKFIPNTHATVFLPIEMLDYFI